MKMSTIMSMSSYPYMISGFGLLAVAVIKVINPNQTLTTWQQLIGSLILLIAALTNMIMSTTCLILRNQYKRMEDEHNG